MNKTRAAGSNGQEEGKLLTRSERVEGPCSLPNFSDAIFEDPASLREGQIASVFLRKPPGVWRATGDDDIRLTGRRYQSAQPRAVLMKASAVRSRNPELS